MPAVGIDIRGASFSWEQPTPLQQQRHGKAAAGTSGVKPPLLQHINLAVRPGEFVAVAGATGAGKSSLLQALLGELTCTAGTVEFGRSTHSGGGAGASRPLRVGFCSQSPLIFGLSLRDNILLGRPWDAARFAAVLRATALDVDVADWAARGGVDAPVSKASLSGGQAARVSLARAIYDADADLYLIDDCLSGLNVQVQPRMQVNSEQLLCAAPPVVAWLLHRSRESCC